MTVVISDSLVLGSASGVNANNPIIGYHNLVMAGSISATTEDTDFPAINLANVSTNLRWKGILGSPSFNDEYITIILDTPNDIDYVGIARHNFGTGLIAVSIEGLAEEDDSPAEWFELTSDVLLPNDTPAIFRFTPQSLYAIRIRLQASQAAVPVAPEAAVVYVGLLLVLERRIYVGHTPLPYGRRAKITNARSESGNFLGRVVLNEMVTNGIELNNLTPGWYRTYLDPFVIASKEIPFFFNWRPGTYPYESGYAWIVNDPAPTNQRSNGMMNIKFELNGIVS